MGPQNRLRLSPLAAILAIALAAPDAAAASRTIFHDGQVFTADPGRPWAQAVAVEGDHVIAVGSEAEVLALATPHTHVIDLGGRTMIPGLNDAHVHVLVPQGTYLNTFDFRPGPGPTFAEVPSIPAISGRDASDHASEASETPVGHMPPTPIPERNRKSRSCSGDAAKYPAPANSVDARRWSGCPGSPAYPTPSTLGCSSRNVATASAVAHWRSIRSARVCTPRSVSHASNAPPVVPCSIARRRMSSTTARA